MVKPAKWMDTFSLLFSVIVVVVSAAWVWQSGTFKISLTNDSTLSWHLVRAAGLSAYFLMTLSMIWGLAVSSRVVKDWSPGVLSMLLHSTISYLALIFSVGHALLLLFDKYYHYRITDLIIPFTGPYRPLASGLGILAVWLGWIISLSFVIKKRMGHKNWLLLHYTSYISYGLITAHALFAGTDAHLLGFKISLILGVSTVIALLAFRLNKTGGSKKPAPKAAPKAPVAKHP